MNSKPQNTTSKPALSSSQPQHITEQSVAPSTPVKRTNSDNMNHYYAKLSPLPFPPKQDLLSIEKSSLPFSQLGQIHTPIVHKNNSFLPLPQQQHLYPQAIDDRIIFESQNQELQPNSSSYTSQEDSDQQQNSGEMQNESSVQNSYSSQPQNSQESKDRQQNNHRFHNNQHKKRSNKPRLSHKDFGDKKVFCNCKKTKCLKLYCDCFRLNLTCEGCNCQGCHNTPLYTQQRSNAIMALMDRNPDPFGQKIKGEEHVKGCNCKKSNCLKKYCECFQAGLKCGIHCKCEQCKNNILPEKSPEKDKSAYKQTAKKQKVILQI